MNGTPVNLGDSTFYRYRTVTFDIEKGGPRSGTYPGGDINFYYQGFVAAARDSFGEKLALAARIQAWNWGEFLIGDDLHWGVRQFEFHQIGQIQPALDWAKTGYDFYGRNK